jgi:hypothetical protein
MFSRIVIGFSVGFLLFLGLNLVSAHLASDCGLPAVFGQDTCADDIARAGWPLNFYESGGFSYRHRFSITSLSLDLGIGILFGGLTSWWYARRAKQIRARQG